MWKSYKHEIILAVFILLCTFAFLKLYFILLPFIVGLLLAFGAMPLMGRIQRLVKNKDVATTLFLLVTTTILILFLVLFTQFINRDFKRLNHSFTVLISDNQDEIDNTAQKVKEYIGTLYDFENLEEDLRTQVDSLSNSFQDFDGSQLDTESIQEAFEKVTSVFQSEENQGETEKSSGGSILVMIFSTIFYFVLILYQMDYFEGVRKTYFSNRLNSTVSQILDDFDQSFWRYMKLRTRIVLLLAILYLITFMIMDMPGMILITIVIIVLSYIPYLQYLALIPVAIGCLVLSIEYSQSFLLLFGIVVGVFILASILEELLLIPWIMERNIGMNPVIMILAASIGSYLFGMVGALIGVPLASLAIIYVKRYFLPSYQVVLQEEEEKP